MGNDTAAVVSLNLEPPKSRRIVKASHPVKDDKEQPAAVDNAVTMESPERVTRLPHVPDSHDVTRESLIDKQKQLRQELVSAASDRHKQRRAQKHAERRSQSGTANKKEGIKPNPFSRFLSVFSVEMHPEHKRSYEKNPDDEIQEPFWKKFRFSSVLEEPVGEGSVSESSSNNFLLVSGVAVATAAVVLAWFWNKA